MGVSLMDSADSTGLQNRGAAFLAVAVQYRATVEDYASIDQFAVAMRLRMEQVARHFQPGLPALVVFPEDIGLGLVLSADFPALRSCRTLEQAGRKLLLRHAAAVAQEQLRRPRAAVAALLKVLSDSHVERFYRETFSQLAREFGVYLCAGSAPIAPDARSPDVYNTSYLFGPEGALLATQSKTHLTEPEREQGLHLSAAPLDSSRVVRLPFATVGIAICYDAFQQGVIASLMEQGADVIVQPSFNPAPWTPEQAAEWETGLWCAVQNSTNLRAGINPMMVGGLFDVVGEGRSSIVAPGARTPDGSGYLARAETATQEEIVAAIIEGYEVYSS